MVNPNVFQAQGGWLHSPLALALYMMQASEAVSVPITVTTALSQVFLSHRGRDRDLEMAVICVSVCEYIGWCTRVVNT